MSSCFWMTSIKSSGVAAHRTGHVDPYPEGKRRDPVTGRTQGVRQSVFGFPLYHNAVPDARAEEGFA